MAQVKLILREDVPKLGDAGDVVSVKPGYARNYLIPRGLANHASDGKLAELEHHKRQIEEKVQKTRKDQEAVKNSVEKIALRIEMQAGEAGRLFGSVTTAKIAELLAEQDVTVDRRKIQLKEPIKEVGDHEVAVRLHRDVKAKVTLSVVGIGGTAAAPEGEPTPEPAPEPEPAPADDEAEAADDAEAEPS